MAVLAHKLLTKLDKGKTKINMGTLMINQNNDKPVKQTGLRNQPINYNQSTVQPDSERNIDIKINNFQPLDAYDQDDDLYQVDDYVYEDPQESNDFRTLQDQVLEYQMCQRPITPFKSQTNQRSRVSSRNQRRPVEADDNQKQRVRDDTLLNQNVIDDEKFRVFIEFKNNKNDFRNPNETFNQLMGGSLNPMNQNQAQVLEIKKRPIRPQTALTIRNNSSSVTNKKNVAQTQEYLSFLNQKTKQDIKHQSQLMSPEGTQTPQLSSFQQQQELFDKKIHLKQQPRLTR